VFKLITIKVKQSVYELVMLRLLLFSRETSYSKATNTDKVM